MIDNRQVRRSTVTTVVLDMENKRVTSTKPSMGFSLLEIMCALFIASTTALVTVPYAAKTYESMKRTTARQLILTDIKYARSQALKKGIRTLVTVDSGYSSYKIGYDNVPYATTPSIETVAFQRKLPVGIYLSFNKSIIFNSRGSLIAADDTLQTGTISLLQNGSVFYTITVYASGAMVNG
jgi:type II secretory pathway pseudopilin PulG